MYAINTTYRRKSALEIGTVPSTDNLTNNKRWAADIVHGIYASTQISYPRDYVFGI
jgi:hypothetical protein